MNTEKQEQPQTTEPQASQVQQPLKDKAEAGRHPFAKLLVKPKVLVIAAVVILVAIAAVAVLLQTSGREEPQPQVFNKSTLEGSSMLANCPHLRRFITELLGWQTRKSRRRLTTMFPMRQR